MQRKAVVRNITLGALATSLVPLTAPGAGAGQHGGSAAGICRSAFGERGPAEGPVVGEGPSGDAMVVSVGWNPKDWEGDIGRVVTCVSVDGRSVPELATSTVEPPNTGSLMLDLTLPAGEPGSLVCEQSLLVDERDAPGRIPPTRPECFKLRASDPPAPVKSGGRTSVDAPAPARRPEGPSAPAGGPAGPPAPSPAPAGPPAPVGPPASGARTAAGSRPARSTASAPAPTPPGRATAAVRGTPPVRATSPAAPVRAAAATGAAPASAASAASPAVTGAAGAPATALPRTGLEHQIPLAGAGLLLALGGAAIICGEPRRRYC
jgi:hypothetical protein